MWISELLLKPFSRPTVPTTRSVPTFRASFRPAMISSVARPETPPVLPLGAALVGALQQALAFLEPALRRTLPGATDDKAGRKDGNAGQSKNILNSSGCFQRGRAPVGLYPKYWQPGTLRKSAKPLTQDFAQTGRICAPLCNRASCADRKIQSFEFHVNQHTTY